MFFFQPLGNFKHCMVSDTHWMQWKRDIKRENLTKWFWWKKVQEMWFFQTSFRNHLSHRHEYDKGNIIRSLTYKVPWFTVNTIYYNCTGKLLDPVLSGPATPTSTSKTQKIICYISFVSSVQKPKWWNNELGFYSALWFLHWTEPRLLYFPASNLSAELR